MKKFIKMYGVLLVGIFLLGLARFDSVTAHSPSSMDLDYNIVEQQLEVSISHIVSDPNMHYVENVLVMVNTVQLVNNDYTSQPSSSSFTYMYNVSAEEGDEIEVIASCNVGGDILEIITISSESDDSDDDTDDTDDDSNGNTISGFTVKLFVPLMIGSLIFISLYRNKGMK